MNKAPSRGYHSELRAEQAEATRERILDGLGRVLAGDSGEVAIAAVAKEARVSLPTVYRHFPTRKDLFEAFVTRHEASYPAAVAALDDVHGAVSMFFARFDDPNDAMFSMRRARASWEMSRLVTVPRRRALFGVWLDQQVPGLATAERERLLDLLVVLLSATTGEAFRGYLDRTGAETADRVSWAIDALVAQARLSLEKP